MNHQWCNSGCSPKTSSRGCQSSIFNLQSSIPVLWVYPVGRIVMEGEDEASNLWISDSTGSLVPGGGAVQPGDGQRAPHHAAAGEEPGGSGRRNAGRQVRFSPDLAADDVRHAGDARGGIE